MKLSRVHYSPIGGFCVCGRVSGWLVYSNSNFISNLNYRIFDLNSRAQGFIVKVKHCKANLPALLLFYCATKLQNFSCPVSCRPKNLFYMSPTKRKSFTTFFQRCKRRTVVVIQAVSNKLKFETEVIWISIQPNERRTGDMVWGEGRRRERGNCRHPLNSAVTIH